MFVQFLSGTETRRLVESEGGQLVDVRTPMEYQRSALPGALNIPLQMLVAARDQLDPARPVIVYCRTGSRSEQAKQFLRSMGFSTVHNLGGFQNYYNS